MHPAWDISQLGEGEVGSLGEENVEGEKREMEGFFFNMMHIGTFSETL